MRLIRIYDTNMRVIDLDEVVCAKIEYDNYQEFINYTQTTDRPNYWICFILKSGKEINFGKGDYESFAQCLCSYTSLVEIMFDTSKDEWDPWGEEDEN